MGNSLATFMLSMSSYISCALQLNSQSCRITTIKARLFLSTQGICQPSKKQRLRLQLRKENHSSDTLLNILISILLRCMPFSEPRPEYEIIIIIYHLSHQPENWSK